MRWRVYLLVLVVGLFFIPTPSAFAQQATNQETYLKIYLKMSSAETMQKHGDLFGALETFKDCYTGLLKLHQRDPDWEKALILSRMNDCRAMIEDLQKKTKGMTAPPPTTPAVPTPPPANSTGSDETPSTVPALKKKLAQVEADLAAMRASYKASQAQVETYKAQIDSVSAQLKALKTKSSVDDRVTNLLSENKALTDKLTAAQKQIDASKGSPKTKLALAQKQLKNLQDQFDASQENNKALQQTTTTLQQRLEQAQSDLAIANNRLSTMSTSSPEYTTIKRENELMRTILKRELEEQARRNQAARLAQEELDRLKLKSSVLQEQVDILATSMTPATTDEERALLTSLKTAAPTITPPPSNPDFSATGKNPPVHTPDASTNAAPVAPVPPVIPSASTNTPPETTVVTPPDTNQAPVTITTPTPPSPPHTPETVTTVVPPVEIVSTNTPPTPAPTPAPTETNVATVVTPPAPDTNSAPLSPTPTPPDTTTTAPTPPGPDTTTAPVPPDAPTVSHLPPVETTVVDTTISKPPSPPDGTQFANKARLPDDMRETAQQAADLFKMNRYDEAAAKYQTIIDKYPESLYAWSNLGVVRFQQGELKEALKALQQAVKLNPSDAFSYQNLGIVYYQMNQFENAIDALNKAKALDPNDAKTRNYLGCACSQKGWQEVAEKEFRKAIEIDPNFGDAHFNLALVYATSKPPSLELARREYNRALELGIAKDERLEKLLKR